MKKVLAACLLVLALCVCAALGEGEICGLMEVVDCKEWVSLREQPDASTARVVQVPLGAQVRNCIRVTDDFWYAEYDGWSGYIMAKYLAARIEGPLQEEQAGVIPCRELLSSGDVVLRYEQDVSVNVIATMDYSEGECLRIGCYRKDGTPVWGWTTLVRESTELSALEVFMAGSTDYRQVMVYNAGIGLTALNLYDGTPDWQLAETQCSLGTSICHAQAQDGTLFIAGYYGPDPVCISMTGEVRWQTSSGSDDVFWPYRITLKDGCIVTCYDSCFDEENAHYEVTYGLDGAMLGIAMSQENHSAR